MGLKEKLQKKQATAIANRDNLMSRITEKLHLKNNKIANAAESAQTQKRDLQEKLIAKMNSASQRKEAILTDIVSKREKRPSSSMNKGVEEKEVTNALKEKLQKKQ